MVVAELNIKTCNITGYISVFIILITLIYHQAGGASKMAAPGQLRGAPPWLNDYTRLLYHNLIKLCIYWDRGNLRAAYRHYVVGTQVKPG